MLTQASDYKYVDTTGVEPALTGQIIPTSDLASLAAPYRYEDICYICESVRTWCFNYTNIGLAPTYTYWGKYYIVEKAWEIIYNHMKKTYQAPGCEVYLNQGIQSMPTMGRYDYSYSPGYNVKLYLRTFAPELMFDHTDIMNRCPYADATDGARISLQWQALDIDVMRLMYWILFQPCYQCIQWSSDGTTGDFDRSYTFSERGIKSGTGKYHKSNSGVITEYTGDVANRWEGIYAYIMPAICTGESRGRKSWTRSMALDWFSYYRTVDGQYESGYEYCQEGVYGDAYAYVDLRRDDVVDAYAFVLYRAADYDSSRGLGQYKFEHLTHESGTKWSVRCFDYDFSKSLMEGIGADFTKVGTRSPSMSQMTRYYCEAYTEYIFVKYNHKYAQGISQQWQWQPE